MLPSRGRRLSRCDARRPRVGSERVRSIGGSRSAAFVARRGRVAGHGRRSRGAPRTADRGTTRRAARDLVALHARGRARQLAGDVRLHADARRTDACCARRCARGAAPSLHVLVSGIVDDRRAADRRSTTATSWASGRSARTSAAGRVPPGVGGAARRGRRRRVRRGRRPAETIAGERARCFRVRATGAGDLPDLGAETDLCLSRRRRRRCASGSMRASGDVDERVARSVQQGCRRRARSRRWSGASTRGAAG